MIFCFSSTDDIHYLKWKNDRQNSFYRIAYRKRDKGIYFVSIRCNDQQHLLLVAYIIETKSHFSYWPEVEFEDTKTYRKEQFRSGMELKWTQRPFFGGNASFLPPRVLAPAAGPGASSASDPYHMNCAWRIGATPVSIDFRITHGVILSMRFFFVSGIPCRPIPLCHAIKMDRKNAFYYQNYKYVWENLIFAHV